MGRSNKSTRYGMPEPAHEWIDEMVEESGLKKVQVLNGVVNHYRDMVKKDEWNKVNIKGMGKVPTVRKEYKGYRVSPSVDDWLDSKSDEYNEDKGDVLYKLLRYCASKHKRNEFDITDITA